MCGPARVQRDLERGSPARGRQPREVRLEEPAFEGAGVDEPARQVELFGGRPEIHLGQRVRRVLPGPKKRQQGRLSDEKSQHTIM